MNGIINLSMLQLAFAYIFAVVLLIIVKKREIKREKEIFISSIRMTLQLMLAGYILTFILKNPNALVTIGIIVIMELFAIYTVFRKFRGKISKQLKFVIAFSLPAGTLVCLFYFLLIVIQISPWYNPQYFIPISGMLMGNSMTGISLGINSLQEGIITRKNLVEEALILGATPQAAVKTIINNSFDAAIMPTINSMVGMGIVILPGMMTGQILSGTAPSTAIAYQIAIMLGILGSVALSVILMLEFGYRTFFNKDMQLVEQGILFGK